PPPPTPLPPGARGASKPPRHSPRSPGNSGARNVDITAAAPAASPTSSTRPTSPHRRRPSPAPPPTARATARHTPRPPTPGHHPKPGREQVSVLRQHQPAQGGAPEAERPQQGEFAAPLPDAAQQHHRQPQRPQQQPQAAERLERRQVGVLYRQVRLQPLRRRR